MAGVFNNITGAEFQYITVPNTNTAPTANAGVDQNGVNVGQVVTLNSSLSSDPDGVILNRVWTQLAGSTPVQLSSTSAVSPTFTVLPANEGEVVEFEVRVTDNGGQSSTDTVRIIVAGIKPAITSTGGFTHIEVDGNATETVDGILLTKFSNSDNTAFAYGIVDPLEVNATDLVLARNDKTTVQQIGVITLPFDLALTSDKVRFEIDVNLSGLSKAADIFVLFNEYKVDSDENRFKSTFESAQTLKMHFDMIPINRDYIRIDDFDEFGPKQIRHSHRRYDANVGGDMVIPIYVRFDSNLNNLVISSISAKATIGPSQFNVDGSFHRGKDRADIVPFEPNDQYNQLLPQNLVTYLGTYTYDKASPSNPHLSISAGSDIITVGDTSDIRVGDVPLICEGPVAVSANTEALQGNGAQTFKSLDMVTKSTLGVQQFVEEILSPTTFRISRPALLNYSNASVNSENVTTWIGTFEPEHACLMIGQDEGSWIDSFTTGITRFNEKMIAYRSYVQFHYINEDDPVTKFKFTQLLTSQANAFKLAGFSLISFGNTYADGYIEIPIPDSFDNTYDQNGNFDRLVVFITPCKRYAVETSFTGAHDLPGKDGEGAYYCRRIGITSLFGRSAPLIYDRPEFVDKGLSTSSRAASTTLTGGVVRKEEIDALQAGIIGTVASIDADLDLAENAIPHALATFQCITTLQTSRYLAVAGDDSTETEFYTSKIYTSVPQIVNAGSGYAVNDVVYLNGNALVKNRLVVSQVNGSGSILSVFNTHTGQYYDNPSQSNHATTTSGNGVGATFNTVGYFNTYIPDRSMQSVSYPATSINEFVAVDRSSGNMPMGSVWTIDPRIDLRAEWKRRMLADYQETGSLSPQNSFEFYALLWAYKKYGGRVGDVSGDTIPVLPLDSRATPAQEERFVGVSNGTFLNMRELRYMLVNVQNFTPFNNVTDYTPTIKLVGGNVEVTQGSVYNELGAYVEHSVERSQDITQRLEITGTVNTSQLGANVLSYNVSALSGEAAAQVQRTVTVVEATADTEAPVITLIGSSSITLTGTESYVEQGATVTDNVDVGLTAAITGTVGADFGTYTITYTATDTAGNTGVNTRTVVRQAEGTQQLTVSCPSQEIEDNIETPFTASVSGGTGNYAYFWRYSAGSQFLSVDDISKLNPIATALFVSGNVRSVWELTVTDGVTTVSATKDIDILRPGSSTTINMLMEDIPDGLYDVTFHYTNSNEFISELPVQFTNGFGTRKLVVPSGTYVDYTIKTATHFSGDTGVTF